MNLFPLRLTSALAALLAAAPMPARALTFTVASRNDAGPGSLRQAILDANTAPGLDTINVTALGLIALRSPLPTLTGDTVIAGGGASRLLLSAGGTNHIFSIAAGATNVLRGLTLADGRAAAGAHGGAISNAGSLTLQSVILTNCHAVSALGGAIYNHTGARLEASNVLFTANSARGGNGQDRDASRSGGGGGGGAGLGGAVFNAGEFTFNACEFNCNSALGGRGGSGGEDGTNFRGGQGGGPNGGGGGAEDFAGGAGQGLGGGGGGGGGTMFGFLDDGGAGAFGGGGGGAGARLFPGNGSGGTGGAAGRFGGRGGTSCCQHAGGGGGGAGLGGAIFTSSGGQGTVNGCRFTRNLAWPGAGGAGAAGVGDGADGAGAGGAVFFESAIGLALGSGNEFSGNAAATAFPDVSAGALVVTNLADAGTGSLRQALADASTAPLPTAIFIELTNVIYLATPLQVAAGELLVNGAGPGLLAVSGSNTGPVLEINAAASLALRGLTIADGRSTNHGAGLRNAGALRLDDCAVRNNHAAGAVGGGVFNSGTLHASRTMFSGNSARGLDGEDRGFGTSGGGGGGGGGLGGGLFTEGTAHLERCTFSGNAAQGGRGGTGGESGFDYAGGSGGAPNGGAAGGGFQLPGAAAGFGGGGGGGGGGNDPEIEPAAPGGQGGLGGGGGGGGGSFPGLGGRGGLAVFGGPGGRGDHGFASGGGGGAGLGGAIFARRGAVILAGCSITGNSASNGVGGLGGAGFFDSAPGTNGAGVAGGIFDLSQTVTLVDTLVSGNFASSSNANSFTATPFGLTEHTRPTVLVNPAPGSSFALMARTFGTGPYTYQWFFHGQLVGTEATLVLTNVTPANSGAYRLFVTTPAGTILSATELLEIRTVITPDVTRPVLSITSPAAASIRVATGQFTLAGTARDASGIAGVFVEPTDGLANPMPANGTTNWSLTVPLRPGTNRFEIFAFDRAGNGNSPDQLRTLYYAVSNRLKLALSGNGTVLPNLHNQPLEIGRGYTMRTTPAPGYIFSNWLGGAFPGGTPLSESATLNFLMQSNLALQANFVPNPFPARAGTYNGLFLEADEARVERSGAFTATVTPLGAFTATLRTAGKSHPFSGQFNAGGLATNRVPRPGASTLTVGLQLRFDGSDRILGRVTDGTWSADLGADRATFHAVTNRATNFLGDYTLALVTDGAATEAVGSVNVSAAGLVKLSGSLFDTPAVTQQVPLSKNGEWPLFVPLHGGRGELMGQLRVGHFGSDSITGRVWWVKPALPATLAASRIVPTTFTNRLSAFGSTYLKPTTNRVLNFSQGVAGFTGAEAGSGFTNTVALSAGNVVTNLGANALSLVIAKPTGLFSGKAAVPGTNRMVTFKGAILQQRGYGPGFFAGTNGLGQVYFGPASP